MLAADERAQHVDFEEAADVVGHNLFEGCGGPGCGAVDERIETAEMAADAVDHGARGVFVTEVGAECGGGVAGFGELGNQVLGAVEAGIRMDGDSETTAGQFENDRAADADGAAGDEGDRRIDRIDHGAI